MTRPRDPPTATDGIASLPHHPLRVAVLWSGAVLCIAGMALTRVWEHWAGGRFAELLVLALASLGLAWPVRRFAHWSWATAIASVWGVALLVFAGPLPVAAVVLVAAAATAAGSMAAGAAPVALACACGLALFAGLLGWLLPLPIHSRWTYLALCVFPVLIGWRELGARLRDLRKSWGGAVALHPRAAALGTLALGLASTGCWLPSMQFDDLAYHLGLPWQLLQEGRYRLDPSHHAWALAPWAADVQQAIPHLVSGSEARGPMNALWIAITAAGLWRLCAALGAGARTRWAVIALYASLPLTSGLAAGMQTETPTAALATWFAWLVVAAGGSGKEDAGGHAMQRPVVAGALLVGGLLALKLMAAAYAMVLVAWAAATRRPWPPRHGLLLAGVVVACVGLSSYTYAAAVAGNPFLPLFNAWFQSPYADAANFGDPRWHAGFSPWLPWQLTFLTRDYSETFAGSAGFALVALAGAWILALRQLHTRGLALAATVAFVVVLLPLQYLRYAFPAMVLLLVAIAIAATRSDPRRGIGLVIAVVVLGFAFQANGNWMQRTGALKQAVLAMGRDGPLLEKYAPERLLARQVRLAAGGPAGNILVMDADTPAYAEFGTRGLSTAAYDPVVHGRSRAADADASGRQWLALLREENVSDIIVRTEKLSPAQAVGLKLAGALPQARIGDAEWWRVAGESPP